MKAWVAALLPFGLLYGYLLWCGDISNTHRSKNVRAEFKDAQTPYEKPVWKRHVKPTRTVPF